MKISIFAKTFSRPTLAATLDAVREHGLDSVQFNLSSAGLPTLPDEITLIQPDRALPSDKQLHEHDSVCCQNVRDCDVVPLLIA